MITVIVKLIPDKDGHCYLNNVLLSKGDTAVQHFTEPLKVLTFMAAMNWSNVKSITIKTPNNEPNGTRD